MAEEIWQQINNARTVPPFSLEKDRYDLSTFIGRTFHFYSVNDPRTLLLTDKDLKEASALIERFKTDKSIEEGAREQLWEARRSLESALHPDTKEPIFPLFRFSAFVPVNMVIVTATLAPAVIRSFPLTAAIHFVNQSYNAAINFANRNASNPIPMEILLQGYAGAVATAMSIGLSATYLTKRVAASGAGGRTVGIIRSTLPFLASSMAGVANIFLMRRGELMKGVDMYDEDGQCRGQSVIAAQTGIAKCAAARVIWNVPIMAAPPAIMMQLEKLPLLQRSPGVKMATEVGVITAALLGAVSPCLAIFPQRDALQPSTLEPRFLGLKTKSGQPVHYLWYNKGL